MKTNQIIVCLLLAVVYPLHVQAQVNTCEALLDEMERNNTGLQVMRDEMEAERLECRTGQFLSNPEVEFHYLWDTHGAGETRKDFTVMQTLDWATLTGQKRRVRKAQETQIDLQYRARCITFRLEARQALIEWQYLVAAEKQLHLREHHAARLAASYISAQESGEVTAVEVNKVKMELTMIQSGLRRMESDRRKIESDLQWMNGGKPIALSPDLQVTEPLPENFSQWYAQAEQGSPVLRYVGAQLDVAQRQVNLARSENYPSLTVGYMTERGPVEGYQGLALGVVVPLWENKNKVKQRKAAVRVAGSRQIDARLQFYNRVHLLYDRARELQQVAEGYRRASAQDEQIALLDKALSAGQLTLMDYYRELAVCYEATDRLLETERDYRLVVAELLSWQW
ncbi:MAG: TolC family protein [Clostridium sp.]|nr:TolC family protein [Clostridium sp.]